VPPPGGEPAVELLGFLELPLDDAPVAIVAGVNEGAIPASVTAHPLLPDSLRRRLGLTDNRRRYARDLHAMTVITRSRPGAVLIAGRRSAEGEPLAPSRLLLACDHATLAQRVRDFYSETHAAPAPPLLEAGIAEGPSRIAAIAPEPGPLLTQLRVTAFRDYLASPYRFYLRHVLKLEGLDDDAVEMSGALFGTLAHDVLSDLGQTELINRPDAEAIAAYLDQRLDAEVQRRFGSEPAAAVVLQVEQLRSRLEAFASRQAQWAKQGWRVLADQIEQSHEATLDVDGEPFTITGRIDRIDLHEDHGYRVVDYKTADAAEPPAKSHRRKNRWVDLQLPLYRELVRARGIVEPVDLGYMQLPRDLGQVGFVSAGWARGEIDDAVQTAHDVVRSIRVGAFGDPGEVPHFDDGLAGPCYDRAADRAAVLAPLGGSPSP
jgi:RecB family exonuclease